MKPEHYWTWQYTLSFVKTFRSIKVGRIPIVHLLLRDYQKYIAKVARQKARQSVSFKMWDISFPIQNKLNALLPLPAPKHQGSGYTLIRAESHGIIPAQSRGKFLLLAHHRRELTRLKGKKIKYRVLYLPHIKPSRRSIIYIYKAKRELYRLLQSKRLAPIFRRKGFIRWMLFKSNRAFRQLRRMQTIFTRYKVKRVIYGSTVNQHGSLSTTFARFRRIPTVNMQHGIFGEIGHFPINSSLNLVWGPAHKAYLEAFGLSKNTLKPIKPLFIRDTSAISTSKISKQSKKKKKSLSILVAMQPIGYSFNRAFVRRLERAAKTTPFPIRFTYKLHPDQGDGHLLFRGLNVKKGRIIPHGKQPLGHLFKKADAVVTPFSSVGLEALINGIPVFHYGQKHPLYYLKHQPRFATSISQIKKALLELGDFYQLPQLVHGLSSTKTQLKEQTLSQDNSIPDLDNHLATSTQSIDQLETEQNIEEYEANYKYIVLYNHLKDAKFYDKLSSEQPLTHLWRIINRWEQGLPRK